MLALSVLATVALCVGVLVILTWLYDNLKSPLNILKAVLYPFFRPEVNQTFVDKYGQWAVITGCTDGIGYEYAKELAKRGMNIVLVSRTKAKLIDVANEIETTFAVKTKWIVADFSKQNIYEHIKRELDGLPVGVLVNNVGRMYDFPDELANISETHLWDMININIGAITMMTRMIVPDMKIRRKGMIVNVSSGSEMQPLPYMTVYAASKVFVKSFTKALSHELSGHGIDVQLLSPMFLRTKMNAFSTTLMAGSVLIPTVESYTRSAVFTLGKTNCTTGFWSHGIQFCAMKCVPEVIRTLAGAQINKIFRDEYFAQHQKAALNQ